MAKAQHSPQYRLLPRSLKNMREAAELTQRDLGKKLRKPQSWVYNCETANRRVDVTEFANWCKACGADPLKMFADVMAKLR